MCVPEPPVSRDARFVWSSVAAEAALSATGSEAATAAPVSIFEKVRLSMVTAFRARSQPMARLGARSSNAAKERSTPTGAARPHHRFN
ncbi:hypothetical protein GCM10029978_105330 [Actinoallomurus acanthiterrae]